MKASSSMPPLDSQQMTDGPFPSRVATDGVQDAKTKAEETNISIPPIELQIIDAIPLRMVPPLDQKPKRGKGPRSPLIDGRIIGLPEGWMLEQRQRTHANYKGKIDQFYYEPGTNKQFRSFKEVEKHLQLKGQKVNPITRSALQKNDQKKLETPPVVDLTNDAAGSSNPDPESTNQQPKRRKIGAKAKRIKFDLKNRPEEITWVLADAHTDNWTAFIGQEKVSDDTQQIWSKTLMEINNPENQDHIHIIALKEHKPWSQDWKGWLKKRERLVNSERYVRCVKVEPNQMN